MNNGKISSYVSLAITLAILSTTGCSSQNTTSKEQTSIVENTLATKTIDELLNTELDTLWSRKFDHHQKDLLDNVAIAISRKAKQGNLSNEALDKLSFYLRIYSSFGPDKDWPEQTANNLNQALIDLKSMPNFYKINSTTARLHENYAVALYRLYFLTPMQPFIGDHIKSLSQLITLYAKKDFSVAGISLDRNNNAIGYALWEILRASAILPYEAVRKNKAKHLTSIKGNDELPNALLNLIKSPNASLYTVGTDNINWPSQHAAWALAQYYNLYNKEYLNQYYKLSKKEQEQLDDGETSLAIEDKMSTLDNDVWSALTSFTNKNNQTQTDLKTLFSIPYVVSTFRGKSECEESSLKDRCIIPTIEEALPIKHVCSESLYILTQTMTTAQLKNSCDKLIYQETVFHEKLATNYQPVANDFNDQLRVVVFENSAEYNKYGQLVFDINTDNGGMYIEGTTQDPDNLATFYSYEYFWIRPEFKVWNLNHEYVHYLDGRFIKYDTFNHFPSNLVWWSEGLAEYISKGNHNPKAFKELSKVEQDEWFSLSDVFNTEYKDGSKRVYSWGYMAVRFMFEQHNDQYLQLAHFLKTDFFDGYKDLLDESGKKYSQEFTTWLLAHKGDGNTIEEQKDENKPRQFYRYTYKNYLQPSHLIETNRHMHWQYWHENALKPK